MKNLARTLVLTSAVVMLAATCTQVQAAQARPANGLQISILAPDSNSIGDRMNLDVSFRGGAVETVELYLDGALVSKRQLGTVQSRGVITFVVETLLLTEGLHDVEVKALSSDGKAVVSSSKVRIPGADLSAPVRIAYPPNGIEVSGTVPVRVQLDSDLQRQKPYVTFFVDKELKVLRNYPPYEYIWDTTKVVNGWHMLEAWTQAADMVEPYKARPINVSVNNSGGQTKKLDRIEDLRTQKPAQAVVMVPNPSSSASVPSMVGGGDRRVALGARPGTMGAGVGTVEPSATTVGRNSSYGETPRVIGSAAPKLPSVSPTMMGGAAVTPGVRIVARKPAALRTATRPSAAVLPGLSGPGGLIATPVASAPVTIRMKAGETLETIGRRTGIAPKEIARLNNLDKETVKPGQSLIVPSNGAFDVAFDGVQIAFDVAPRVDAGVHMAPFRQIFEHTGGKLYWFGGNAKTVRAVNSTREVEIKVGKGDAVVNNQVVHMEKTPYLETGRTIVPLSFVRDALDLRIQFNPGTGRMLLNSK